MILTHRRPDENIETGYVTLFAEEGNENYGDHVWELKTKLPPIDDELVEWTADYYDTDLDEARELVDPPDIVNNAGAWDDPQFVSDLWQAMESKEVHEVPGYRTSEGAVVIDLPSVDLEHWIDDDDDDDDDDE